MALIHQVRFGFGLLLFGLGIIISISSAVYFELLVLVAPRTSSGVINTLFGNPTQWFVLGFALLLIGVALIQYSFRQER